jgi:hypothetical protein
MPIILDLVKHAARSNVYHPVFLQHNTMKHILNSLTAFLFFLSMALPLSAQQSGWVLKSNKDNVKVYYKKTSDVYELKLTTSMKVPPSGIVLLFNEIDQYAVWGYKILSARLIKTISESEVYYHSKIDFPWPIDDRDVVMHSKIEQNPTTKVVTCKSVAAPDLIPAETGFIRMRNSRTTWTLVPSPDGWTYIEYYIYSSPGGSIPDWLVNTAIDVGPRETIKSMKQILKSPRFQNAQLAHIKD